MALKRWQAGRQKDYADIRNRLRGAYDILYVCHAGGKSPELIFMYIAGGLASFAITFGTHAVCSSVIAEWFVEKRAQVTGMVLSGAGLGRGSMGIPCGPALQSDGL